MVTTEDTEKNNDKNVRKILVALFASQQEINFSCFFIRVICVHPWLHFPDSYCFPAWYELRTSGPETTCLKPMESASSLKMSNSSGW